MHNELTKKDIEKMQEEMDYRITVLRPKILEEVKFARGHGDLSENFEYKAAKQERGKNESRIRFLRNMIKTAVIIEDNSSENEVGLYDKVTYYIEEDDEEETVMIVTTVRHDALSNIVSKESPIGMALFGKKIGEKVTVNVDNGVCYDIIIKKIEKGEDDGSLSIRKY
ncbi:MAG: transcription elongation factor GreA [Acutalibacteraceae bacterium]|nr:transcription elongation factor GreA [Acutalibacteraceae bacterium]